MAQHGGEALHIHAASQSDGGKRVPQIVETNLLTLGVFQDEVQPLEIEVVEDLALIATVGRNLHGRAGVAGHLFGMLGQAGVSVRMITQGCDEINIIVGVEEKDFELAIQTIYKAFSDENGIVETRDLEPTPQPF